MRIEVYIIENVLIDFELYISDVIFQISNMHIQNF